MDIITSGVRGRAQFTMTARHEMRPVNGLAPELTKAQAATLVAVSTGVRGLGAEPEKRGFSTGTIVAVGLAAVALVLVMGRDTLKRA